jgi:hypothetical protein
MAWRGLEVLRLLSGGAKLTRDIAEALGVAKDTARDICKRLAARGLTESVQGVHNITKAGREALAGGTEVVSGPGKGGCAERYKGSVRAKAWRALRIRRKVDVDMLLPLVLPSNASPTQERNTRLDLTNYLRALTAAGYLALLPQRAPGVGRRWLLINDSGPCAPAWNKAGHTVTDANTGEVRNV